MYFHLSLIYLLFNLCFVWARIHALHSRRKIGLSFNVLVIPAYLLSAPGFFSLMCPLISSSIGSRFPKIDEDAEFTPPDNCDLVLCGCAPCRWWHDTFDGEDHSNQGDASQVGGRWGGGGIYIKDCAFNYFFILLSGWFSLEDFFYYQMIKKLSR